MPPVGLYSESHPDGTHAWSAWDPLGPGSEILRWKTRMPLRWMASRADSKLHRRRVPPVMCVYIPHGGRKESSNEGYQKKEPEGRSSQEVVRF